MLYLVASASMGFWMLLEAFATWRERDEVKEPAAKRLFVVSLFYVFVPFAALIVERLLHLPAALGMRRWMMIRSIRTAGPAASGASAISRWRWRWAGLVILFFVMSIVQWHENLGH